MKYKNPPISRDVIVFDGMINWNEPITLVEGVFDSFSVKRNVIPLLGKFLLSKLKNKILKTLNQFLLVWEFVIKLFFYFLEMLRI